MYEYNLLNSPIEVAGALDFQKESSDWVMPRRFPAWTRSQVLHQESLNRMIQFPSGVRLRFQTSADTLSFDVWVSKFALESSEPLPMGFDLVVNGKLHTTLQATSGNTIRLHFNVVSALNEKLEKGESERLNFSGLGHEHKEIELWLPTSGKVSLSKVYASQEIIAPQPDLRKRWVHYGSSISQCMEVSHPLEAWPVHAAQLLDLNLTNLSLSGECQVDGFAARTIRDLPADFISLKLGINIVNGDTMRERAFISAVHSFLDSVREQHTKVPILLISPVWCALHENTPGPTFFEGEEFVSKERPKDFVVGALALTRIRTLLEEIYTIRSDENLFFLDGLKLLNSGDSESMCDGIHPDASGYHLMAQRFVDFQKSMSIPI